MTDSTSERAQTGPCGCFVGLWIDDERPVPEKLLAAGWCWARNFHEAVLKLEIMNFIEISVDHDLASFYGNKEMTGRDILWWLVARKQKGEYTPRVIKVHSANPVGGREMKLIVKQHLS